jgi:hypothetical protein
VSLALRVSSQSGGGPTSLSIALAALPLNSQSEICADVLALRPLRPPPGGEGDDAPARIHFRSGRAAAQRSPVHLEERQRRAASAGGQGGVLRAHELFGDLDGYRVRRGDGPIESCCCLFAAAGREFRSARPSNH